MDTDSESKLVSLITKLLTQLLSPTDVDSDTKSKAQSRIVQVLSFISSLDLESQPKPESEFMSLTSQTISLFKSMDQDSQPEPLSKLISLLTGLVSPTVSGSGAPDADELFSLVDETVVLKPEPELISFVYQILSLVRYMESRDENLISVCPQVEVRVGEDNILYLYENISDREYNKWGCLNDMRKEGVNVTGGKEGASYFYCGNCKGRNHERYEKFPIEIKHHPHHPKHPLKLADLYMYGQGGRKCYCCDEDLSGFVYCCLACDFAMNMSCVEKPRVLSVHHLKRHEHPLALFSRTTSMICDVCALTDSTCPFYICAPCGFAVHRRCFDLPRVIQISRHPHRISFASSFRQGDWSCGVCRRKVHNDYGGYFCNKNDCPYAAHSRCATQSNVWDGIELEGVPEEIEEELAPFVIISDGIIQHFSHEDHHLRLDKNTDRDYDEDKLCQACITPIYFGKLYACMQCDFILHEECANLRRKTFHPIHPHPLTLVQQDSNARSGGHDCSACSRACAFGLVYECHKKRCRFQVHVQCGIISEPLVHASHMHPLFLTSKPGEERECECVIRNKLTRSRTKETWVTCT